MIEFVAKSSICLIVLFGFYHILLRNIKSFNFNRYYLLFSLLFSMIIPFINIRIGLCLSVNTSIHGFTAESTRFIHEEMATIKSSHFLTIHNTLIIFYTIISSILLFRFVGNIYKILRLIRTSTKVDNKTVQLVLIDNQTLPYSFFRNIFINRMDYENGRIEKELIIHEKTHCIQYHSVDILIVELVKIILWFNPFIWFFRNAIQLNHEYLADDNVLASHDLIDYQQVLINYVFRNNSTYLASNFDYSLTKKRLIMMKNNKSTKAGFLRKIAVIPLFLILVIPLAFSQAKQVVEPKASVKSQKTTLERKEEKTKPPMSFSNEQEAGEKDIKAAKEEKRILAEHRKKLADEQKASAEEQQILVEKQKKLADEQKAITEEEKLKNN